MTTFAICLLIFGFPIMPIITNIIRHQPRYMEPGVGTQHIAIVGMLIQFSAIGAGIGILLAKAS